MLFLLPIFILILTAGGMAILAQFRPRFTYHWLIAVSGAGVAWVSTWILRLGLPHETTLIRWQPEQYFFDSPAILIDDFSWPFMIALTTLALTAILTDVRRASTVKWQAWSGSLAMVAVGLLAVVAGNPLTLVLVWSIIDILELVILLPRQEDPKTRQGLVVYFSFSILGTMLILMGDLFAYGIGQSFSFSLIPSNVVGYLLLGVGLRLGVLPLHVPFVREPNFRRGFGTIVRMVPVAASMVFLTRIATSSTPDAYPWIILLFFLLSAAYGAVAWARLPNELAARPYWVLVLASLAFASAVRGLPAATLAWSLALLLSGSVLFLFSETNRRLIWLPMLGAISLSALPFTPTAAGSALFTNGFQPLIYLFFPIWGILLAGYIRHVLRHRAPFEAGPARSITLIYPLGLAIGPITHWILGIFYLPAEPTASWWPALIVVGFAGIVGLLSSRGIKIPTEVFAGLDSVFSFRWAYTLLGGVYNYVAEWIVRLTRIFEGEGSILWSFLLAILLFSLLMQFGGGL